MLLEIATHIFHRDYPSIYPHMLEEAANQIAEDVLFDISKKPEHFINGHDNFLPYYKFILRRRIGKVFVEFYKHKDIVFLDEYDEDLLAHDTPTPIDFLIRNDRSKIFVENVYNTITDCPRFGDRSEYLVWPMIASLLIQREDCLFDSLDFRDRVALRMILVLVDNEKSRLLNIHND
jgi:hypothetical protein